MTAYPKGGPAGVLAHFPTVWDPTLPAIWFGPRHVYSNIVWLGPNVTWEDEADIGPDQDGVNNIDPPADTPDQDVADDGVQLPLTLPHCQPTTFNYVVTVMTTTPPLFLNVWFDWNRDGTWDDVLTCTVPGDAPEWAIQDLALGSLPPGTYTFTTPAFLPWHPGGDWFDPIWMRITLSEGPPGTAMPEGGAPPGLIYSLGETEDYYFEPPAPPADVAITKTVQPANVAPGDWVTYILSYANNGPANAASVVITDILPAELLTSTANFTIWMSYGPGVIAVQHHYVWFMWTVPAGGRGVITVTAQVDPNLTAAGTIFNQVAIGTTTPESDYTNNTDSASQTLFKPPTLLPPWLSDDDVADAPYHSRSPTVDGRIDPGEYAGAGKITFPGYGGDVEVFFKQDGGYLYVAFDFPDPQTASSAAQIFLDTKHDGGTAPQTDDYRFSITRAGVADERRGTGAVWGSATAPISWTAASTTTLSGWQAEFAIQYDKLGLTAGTFQVMGLSLINAWTPSWDHYWPSGAFWTNPSTWGDLVSSSGSTAVPSGWDSFYWKPGPWEDYAPSGMPDFDQNQQGWQAYDGPAAAANSLWWFDSKFETPDHSPPAISDTYRLVWSYDPFVWDDHHYSNTVPLIDDLAWYFGTNQGIVGTDPISMFLGTHQYLRDHGLWDDYIVTLVEQPDFYWITDEVMRSEDVILLLGFYEWIEADQRWARVGGHYVNVAGVDPTPGAEQIAFSDPFIDNAEWGGPGRVLSGTLIPHQPIPGHTPEVHNDAGNVSHDVYFMMDTDSPGGTWGPVEYPLAWELWPFIGANPNPLIDLEPYTGGEIQVEVEFALTVSPYTWKASGEWHEEEMEGWWEGFEDYAPNGIPDFDEKQDNWVGPPFGNWTFCGPIAAANSLWWFDSKFEPNPIPPPTINDSYPLVQSYNPGGWDDHDPLNVDDPNTPWPPGVIVWPPPPPPMPPGQGEFVEDLALYFQTDQFGSGTYVQDLYAGIEQYITDHGLRQGYVITMVESPDFWWVAEEVEVSEDVILLLGFWQQHGADGWVRLGGHYVTLPGVDKQGGFVAFSDPWFDRIEQSWYYAGIGSNPGWPSYLGRVAEGWLIPHQPIPGHPPEIHNDAGNVSHDVYYVTPTDSPGGVWGPWDYVTEWGYDIENFIGQNGEQTGDPDPALPIQTEVEWAVAVSPVADVGIIKTVTPATVAPGDWVTFTITFSNEGSLPAESVVITDLLPSELVNATWNYWTSNGFVVSARPSITYVWNLPDLAWREWGIITVTAQVSPTASGLVTNTVEIATSSVEQYQIVQYANTAQATFTVVSPLSYAWLKQVNGVDWHAGFSVMVQTSDTIKIVDVISTSQPFTLTEIWNTDHLSLTTYLPSAGTVVTSAGWLTWTAPGGQPVTLTKEFYVEPCTWTTTILEEALYVGGGMAERRAIAVAKTAPDLWINSAYQTDVIAGDLAVFTLNYGNRAGYENDVWITNVFPISAPFYSSVPAPTSADPDGLWAAWDVGNLATGDWDSIEVTVDISDTLVPCTWITITDWIYDHAGNVAYTTTITFHVTEPPDWHWKSGLWEDYAPSGIPDFDQMQVAPTFCGPFAAANSLWWFDSKFEQNPVGPLPGGPPSTIPISDSYTLVEPYGPWDDHDPQNVLSLTLDLGINYFNTDNNPMGPGTYIYDMYSGTQRYLRDHGLWDDYIVTLVEQPEFDWIAEEVKRSEDVILLLGFWEEIEPGFWNRIGGHYVTVAGVDPVNFQLAFSDPVQDWAGMGGPGRVLSGTLIPHNPPHTGVYTIHNDAGNVSHDAYTVVPGSPSPGGSWWIPDYKVSPIFFGVPGLNPNPRWLDWMPHQEGATIHTEIEYALAVSPFTWKASGRWVEDEKVELYGKRFEPYEDFAPSGVPDLDQKQDEWRNPDTRNWSFCGPVAAANSLWWFDSKFEYHGAVPPIISDTYPLVFSPDPARDDHHPDNVQDLVGELAALADTDGLYSGDVHNGTVITDLYSAIITYTQIHELRQGYVITKVHQPEFWWVAEEVERSEDVILLLGFYADVGGGLYERVGGHYVTVPGVDKEGRFIAFSDPYWDRMETALPPNEFAGRPWWTGRVGSDGDPPLGPSGLLPAYAHTPLPHTGVYTLHNDAANVSHDVYNVIDTDSPGGIWGPEGYVAFTEEITNFVDMNGRGNYVEPGFLVQTEVEWAIAVSPVADVWITKTVTPTTVAPGEWVTFTITFSNGGSLPAENVVISDVLPPGLVNPAVVGKWNNYGGAIATYDTFTWTVGSVPWQGRGIITVTAQVGLAASGIITNTAAITTTTPEQYQISQHANTAQATFTVKCVKVTGVTLVVTNTGTIYTDTVVHFNADIAPDDADKPYNYRLTTDGAPGGVMASSADPLLFTDTFATTGTHTVEIAVWNCAMTEAQAMTGSVVVTVSEHVVCVDLTSITIAGATTGYPGVYTFTTSYLPQNATPPIAYVWDNGDNTATSIRTLGVGTHTLMVTATNCTTALVTDTHPIVISPTLPDVTITKTVQPADVVPGDPVTYVLTYANVGLASAASVVITDVLPPELLTSTASYTASTSYVSGPIIATDHYVWSMGTVPVGGRGVITITAQVDPSLTRAGTIVNQAAIGTTTPESDYSNNDDSASQSLCIPPSGASFVYAPPNPVTGQTVVFTGSVALGDPAPAYTWDFGDGAGSGNPATHVYNSAGVYTVWMTATNSCDQAVYSGTVSVCEPAGNASIQHAPAEPWVNQTAFFTATASGSGVITYAWAADDGWTASGDTTTHTFSTLGNHTVWLTATNSCGQDYASEVILVRGYGVDLQPPSGGTTGKPGGWITYTLTLLNTGNMTDTYTITGSVSGEAWPTNWPATVGPVAGGGNAPLDVTVWITSASGSSQVVITATSQGDGSKQDTSVLTTTVTTQPTLNDVEIAPHTAAQTGDVGTTVTYTLRVTNTGTISDYFNLSIGGHAWGTTLSVYGLNLKPGEGQPVTVYVQIPAGAISGTQDVATITARSAGAPAVFDSATLTTTAYVPTYGVELTPPTAQQTGYSGDVMTYTLTVRNTGERSDTYTLSKVGNTWPTTLSVPSVGPLAPNATAQFSVTVQVPFTALSGTQDVATITACSTGDPTVSGSATLTTTARVPNYDVELTPLVAQQAGHPGDVMTYTLTVRNTGERSDTYTLSKGLHTWPTTLSVASVGPLAPNGIAQFSVTVQIPTTVLSGAFGTAQVTATSQKDGSKSDTAVLTTTAIASTQPITRGVMLTATITARDGTPGTWVTYTLRVTNTGNVADFFNLTWQQGNAWPVDLSYYGLSLGAGQGADVLAYVRPPLTVSDGTTDTVTIKVTSANDAAATDSVALTTTARWPHRVHLPLVLRNYP